LGAGDLVTPTLLLEEGSITSAGGVLRAAGDFELQSGSVYAPIAGPGNLKKTKAGTVVLACPLGYDGYTRIEGGTLRLGASDVLPDGTFLILSAAGGYSTLFDLDGHNETIARLSGTVGPVTLGSGTLTLAPTVSSTSPYSGSIRGTGGLIMAGTQSQRLFGSLSYTGPTVIESGTLIFASSTTLASSVLDIRPDGVLQVSSTTPFVLKPGQRLQGTGRVVNGLTVQGTVAPGSSAGILTVDNITFADGSVLEIELDGTEKGLQYDVLSSSGTITLQPGSTLEVVLGGGFAPAPGDAFDVLDFAGLAGAFGDLHMPDLGSGLSWDTGALYTQGTVQVVPEPAALSLLALGVLALLRRRHTALS
jgi:MYXO-CTERM domain-containing protein